MNKIFVIFESGRTYSLNCTVYSANKGYSRPVDAYIITESDGDFTTAAKRAVESVYSYTVKKGFSITPSIAGFDLLERDNQTIQISGESGGLAFAVAFAKCILKPYLAKSDFDNLNNKDVAATGVISSNGTIKRVNGIEQKLKKAAEILPENSWILFPEENQKDITFELEKIFKNKNHKVSAVSNVDMIMELLLGDNSRGKLLVVTNNINRKFILKILFVIVTALIVIVFAGEYYIKTNFNSFNLLKILETEKVLIDNDKKEINTNEDKIQKVKQKIVIKEKVITTVSDKREQNKRINYKQGFD